MRIQSPTGGAVNGITGEPEGLWDAWFMDAPGPGDVEATLTGQQIIDMETSGVPSEVAAGNAAEGNLGPFTPAQAEAVTGAVGNLGSAVGSLSGAVAWLSANTLWVLGALLLMAFLLLAMGGGV